MNLFAGFSINLALSLIVECGLCLLLFRARRTAYAALLCNLLTNPALNLILLLLTRAYPSLYWPVLIALELSVVGAEAAVYRYLGCFGLRKALLVSLLLNAASYGVGYAAWRWVF